MIAITSRGSDTGANPTNEEMYREGAKYGSIDPCFPSKLTQAHLHALLFHVHRPGRLLDYIFFPCVTANSAKSIFFCLPQRLRRSWNNW